MKRYSLLLLAVVMMAACKKDTQQKNFDKYNISAQIKQDSLLKYPLGLIGIEDEMRITMPPAHADSSAIIRDASEGKLYYNYQASPGFSGADRITLMHYISAGGPPVDSSAIYLTIEVLK